MTLDEAIKHCKEVAKNLYAEGDDECTNCAKEHEQLAEWLEDYKRLLEEKPQRDLISREALYNDVDTWGCNDYDKYDFLEAIDNAPTVDRVVNVYPNGEVIVQEKRPKGEWKNYNSYFKICSLCNKTVGFDYIEQNGERFNYCPNCGADMRGAK